MHYIILEDVYFFSGIIIQFCTFFLDVFVTTDIHNAACIPPSAKRPTNNTTTTTNLQQQQTAPPQQLGTVPFSPMDQMEELDVAAAYCYPLTVSKHFFINCCAFSRKKIFQKQNLYYFPGHCAYSNLWNTGLSSGGRRGGL